MPGISNATIHCGVICFFAFIDVLHISATAWSYVMRLVARGCADTRDPALISLSARKENLGL